VGVCVGGVRRVGGGGKFIQGECWVLVVFFNRGEGAGGVEDDRQHGVGRNSCKRDRSGGRA